MESQLNERSERPLIKEDDLELAITLLRERIKHAFKKHGNGKFLNPYELLGVIRLEYKEFEAEVQNRDKERQMQELLDVATVSICGVASILE